ncbi:MAG: endonuclease/exonuclease/phosphatase family protein [Bacteroidota bacterium]
MTSKLKLFLAVIATTLVACNATQENAQQKNPNKKEYKITTVAFYNLENLFDTINDPNKQDHKNPIGEMASSEQQVVYPKKLANMAKVIADIGVETTGFPPAIIGVCEIENYDVLEDLVNHPRLKNYNYGIIHYESPDLRSIDVALLYRKDVFQPEYSKPHEVFLYRDNDKTKRNYTRDVLHVKGKFDGEEMHFLVNHWPSRSGGEEKSRPNRVEAAKVAKGVIDSVQKVDPNAKMILMGDLNDDPHNESMKEVINAKETIEELIVPQGIYNPYASIYKKGIGTTAWRDNWNLFDQIAISQPLTEKEYSTYSYYQAKVFNPTYLRNPRGRYKGYPFRSFSGSSWTGGYSDHFPVYIHLIKELKEEE